MKNDKGESAKDKGLAHREPEWKSHLKEAIKCLWYIKKVKERIETKMKKDTEKNELDK